MNALKESPRQTSEESDLQRRVVGYLATKHLASLRRLEVVTQGATVTLRGCVDSFYEKQVALHCCRRVAGVRGLVDDLVVRN